MEQSEITPMDRVSGVRPGQLPLRSPTARIGFPRIHGRFRYRLLGLSRSHGHRARVQSASMSATGECCCRFAPPEKAGMDRLRWDTAGNGSRPPGPKSTRERSSIQSSRNCAPKQTLATWRSNRIRSMSAIDAQMISRLADSRSAGGHSRAQFELQSFSAGFAPHQRTKDKRECDNESTHHPAMIEPKRVDPRSLRIGSQVGNRNGIASRKSDDRLLGRIHDAMYATALICEFKYGIGLIGVRTLEADDSTLYVDGGQTSSAGNCCRASIRRRRRSRRPRKVAPSAPNTPL
jgi:hypothetical protein